MKKILNLFCKLKTFFFLLKLILKNLEKINNILVIRLSSMGDVILTSSFIRQLRKSFPNSRIDFITSKSFSEIYKYNPHISHLWEYEKEFTFKDIVDLKGKMKSDLQKKRYDIVIDLQKNLRSKVLRSGLGDKYLFVKKLRLNKLSLVYFKRPLLKNILAIPEIYRLTVSHLGVEDDGNGLELWLPYDLKDYHIEKEIFEQKNSMTIAIAPGAFHETKRWQKEKFLELMLILRKKYNTHFKLIGGIKDKDITDWIKSKIDFEFEDMTESNSIIKTTIAIDTSDMLISNDTGVVHIAAARKVPVVAIFGSTVKEFGFFPYKTKYEIVEKAISCRPCTHYGLSKCPKGHFDCMNKITVDDVLDSVEKLLR